ncbi:MAG TPA: NAD(P)H-hydrate dehydratase [Verrucomicrobiae bacterium]|nr:NAD(P)H-hydrate dehydratase [Verrucomicrobiae bacterium]
MYEEIFAKLLKRPADSHKYRFGHVLVVGGSPGMVGAPLLTALAALRTGAGLVTIASQAAVTDKLERRVKEIMTLALSDDAEKALAELTDFIRQRKVSVVAVGPGLAVEPANRAFVERLVRTARLPLIIDGGGLSLLQHHLDWLDEAASKTIILTPHTGEFQRLINKKLPFNRSELKPLATSFTKTHHITLVLKGEPTYIAHPDGHIYENSTGNPGLSTAGTGDVLTGVIAGLIAQTIEPAEAAEIGVYLHGLAGDLAAAEKTEPGMIASDVIETLPAALRRAGGTL